MKKRLVLLSILFMICLPFTVKAADIDTTAGISFTGENPNKPAIPLLPPGEVPDGEWGNGGSGAGNNGGTIGRLPQTNDLRETNLLILGTILIALAIGFNHINKNKRREQI